MVPLHAMSMEQAASPVKQSRQKCLAQILRSNVQLIGITVAIKISQTTQTHDTFMPRSKLNVTLII